MISNLQLLRNIRHAKKVFWWGIALAVSLELIYGGDLEYGYFSFLLVSGIIILVLFSYLIFLGFRDITKFFHTEGLLAPIVFGFVTEVVFSVLGGIVELIDYGGVHTWGMIPFLTALSGGIYLVWYGAQIGQLPRVFGELPSRAKIANICSGVGVLLLAPFLLVSTITPPFFFQALAVFVVILYIMTFYYNYHILRTAVDVVALRSSAHIPITSNPAPTPLGAERTEVVRVHVEKFSQPQATKAETHVKSKPRVAKKARVQKKKTLITHDAVVSIQDNAV